MIKNIIFDFGGVLVDWNPHYLFDSYFNDTEKCNWFIENVCNTEWNAQMDKGKPFEIAVNERIAQFPEYEDAIRLYHKEWMKTMGEEIPGMFELIKDLKENGYPIIYGLTNWSNETFPMVQKQYKIFSLIDNIVCSGDEKLLKPDPKIYQILLDRYNLKAEESVFIDDNVNNVKGAIDMGMKSIRFVNAEHLRKDLDELINQK